MIPVIDDKIHIDELIKAVRQRMAYGMGPVEIARDLGRFVSQEEIYLCYHASKILNKDWGI